MLELPRYERYKVSDVPWLGEFPSHWKLCRLRNATESCINGTWGTEPDGINDTACIRVADFSRNDYRVSANGLTFRSVSASEYKSRSLRPGDLLLEKSGGGDKQLVGQVVSFEHNFPAVCSNFVARLRVSNDFHSRFVAYYHAFLYAIGVNYKHIKQTTGIQNLDSSSYLSEWLAYPSYEEQTRIAAFLDEKTAEIDAAIAKKQRLIELLQEQKAILINRAVTKGLHPHVPTKESGVAWIGEIPSHWEKERAKWLFKQVKRPIRPDDEIITAFRDGEVTLRKNRRTEGFTNALQEHGYQGIRKGDLVIHAMDAFAGAIGVSDSDGKSTPVYSVCVPSGNFLVNVHYYAYLLRRMSHSGYILALATGIRQRSTDFRFNDFANLLLPVPPLAEQAQIVGYIHTRTAEYNVAISNENRAIALLEELKRILISQAVTGKIKI